MKRYFGLIAALLAAILVIGCGAGEPSSEAVTEPAATESQESTEALTEEPTTEEPSTEAAASAEPTEPAPSFPLSSPLNIGVLKGPTGIGMAALFDMEADGYKMQLFDAPDQVTAKLISGELDIAALPSNLGSVLYNTTEGEIEALAIVCGSTLYLVGNTGEEIADVKDLAGKTIYASGQGGVPEYVLSYVLKNAGIEDQVKVEWLASHADAMSTMLTAQGGAIAMLPEPNVTVAKSKSDAVKVLVDLGAKWEETAGSKLPMGILAVRKEVVENRADDLRTFLEAGLYSTDLVTALGDEICGKIAELGIVPSAGIAKSVIPACDIMFYNSPRYTKEPLETFYEILFELNPAAIGKELPEEDYYADLRQ